MAIDCKCSLCGNELKRQLVAKNHFCDRSCKGVWQTQQREALGFTKDWLIDEYINKKKSANQIASEVKRDPKRVWEWIVNYGIETRSRGSEVKNHFKKGQESAFKGKKHTEENKQKIREIRLKDGGVPYLKDGVHWLKAYQRKPASWRGGITPDRQAFYASDEWSSVVKEVWKRDNAICQKCGKHHNTEESRGKFHIHHIVSFTNKELRAELSNLILLCRQCHLWVHSNQNVNKEFINEINK